MDARGEGETGDEIELRDDGQSACETYLSIRWEAGLNMKVIQHERRDSDIKIRRVERLLLQFLNVNIFQQISLRMSYKLLWPEPRMVINTTADWSAAGEINVGADLIEHFWEVITQFQVLKLKLHFNTEMVSSFNVHPTGLPTL